MNSEVDGYMMMVEDVMVIRGCTTSDVVLEFNFPGFL